jgi:hypothetical protein
MHALQQPNKQEDQQAQDDTSFLMGQHTPPTTQEDQIQEEGLLASLAARALNFGLVYVVRAPQA